MTDKQSEALRLADLIDNRHCTYGDIDEAADELRRLHEVNAELVEALQAVIRGVPDTWEGVVRAKAVLRKSQGDNNG
jgi:hypothetical protein